MQTNEAVSAQSIQQAVIEKLADSTDYPRRYSTYDVHGLASRITKILERL